MDLLGYYKGNSTICELIFCIDIVNTGWGFMELNNVPVHAGGKELLNPYLPKKCCECSTVEHTVYFYYSNRTT